MTRENIIIVGITILCTVFAYPIEKLWTYVFTNASKVRRVIIRITDFILRYLFPLVTIVWAYYKIQIGKEFIISISLLVGLFIHNVILWKVNRMFGESDIDADEEQRFLDWTEKNN